MNKFYTEEIMPTPLGLPALFSGNVEGKNKDREIKIYFLTDFLSYQKELQAPHQFFSMKAQDLFLKMMTAMNLTSNQYQLGGINSCAPDCQKCQKNWQEEVVESAPQFLVTLGPSSTFLVLEETLSQVRGKVFNKTIKSSSGELLTKVISLLHPEFLLINPSMKRTAWLDMQLIMKSLN